MTAMLYNLNPDNDPNRLTSAPHWRIYHPRGERPTAVNVQDFDYRDYDYSRFVTYAAFDSEDEAMAALDTLRDHARRLLAE